MLGKVGSPIQSRRLRVRIGVLFVAASFSALTLNVLADSVVDIWENDGQPEAINNPLELEWTFFVDNNSDVEPCGGSGPCCANLCELRLQGLFSTEMPVVLFWPQMWMYSVTPQLGQENVWDIHLWEDCGGIFCVNVFDPPAHVQVLTYRDDETADVTGVCVGQGKLDMVGWMPEPPDTFVGPSGVLGDLNRDGEIDLDDFPLFESCVSGPANSSGLNDDCRLADFDYDDDVDLNDFGSLQHVLAD